MNYFSICTRTNYDKMEKGIFASKRIYRQASLPFYKTELDIPNILRNYICLVFRISQTTPEIWPSHSKYRQFVPAT